ncbi:MAG TPA: dihydrodipicolinate synthase family protein [bacterium]|nr:dihydrodipicolinate synthase family protein [bacterium]
MKRELTGIIAAVHTPMQDDGSLNLDRVQEQATCLQGNGVTGAFLCGTTGEGMSLSLQERMQLAEKWREIADSSFPILIHVGHLSLEESKVLARHAQSEIGAAAIAAVAPSYYKPETVEELVDFCEVVASAAPDTPFYYYHIPAHTGVDFPMIEFLKRGHKYIPTLAGIKYSHADMMDLGQCLEFEDGKYQIFFGQDENLLAALALGVEDAIGSMYNFAAPLFLRIVDAIQHGDFQTARQAQSRARQLAVVLERFHDVVATKAAMRAIDIDCGPPRLPLHRLSEEEYTQFHAALNGIDFFDYASKT